MISSFNERNGQKMNNSEFFEAVRHLGKEKNIPENNKKEIVKRKFFIDVIFYG